MAIETAFEVGERNRQWLLFACQKLLPNPLELTATRFANHCRSRYTVLADYFSQTRW